MGFIFSKTLGFLLLDEELVLAAIFFVASVTGDESLLSYIPSLLSLFSIMLFCLIVSCKYLFLKAPLNSYRLMRNNPAGIDVQIGRCHHVLETERS